MRPELVLAESGAVFAILIMIAILVFARGVRRDNRLRRRMQLLAGIASAAPPQSTRPSLVGSIAAIGNFAAKRGLFSASTRAEMEETLASLGLRGKNALGLFLGSKISFFVLGPALAFLAVQEFSLAPPMDRFAPAVAAVAGLLLPEFVVRRLRKRYLERVERGVPDTLDMMVLCAQAGLGLEPALARVTGEIGHAHPEIARELRQTVDEMRLSVERRTALVNFGARTQLDSVKRVMTTLAQTIQYGTPLTESLRSLAAEMRTLTLTRYEEKAARLPVMLTLPMIVFIFPCVFIVIGAPAVLHIMQAFTR